jgi:uncharacterized ferritin-like protein (DUF455 family)
MRGKPMNRESRRKAGLTDPFLDELAAWAEVPPTAAR